MGETGNGIEELIGKAVNWLSNKIVPGGLPTIPEKTTDYYLVDSTQKPDIPIIIKQPPSSLEIELIKLGIKYEFSDGVDPLFLLTKNADLWSVSITHPEENLIHIDLGIEQDETTISQDSNTYALKPEIASDYINLDEIDLPEKTAEGDTIYYRGISRKELDYIIKEQVVMGYGNTAHRGERSQGTFLYLPRAKREALGYATTSRIVDQATITKPRYLIGLTKPQNVDFKNPNKMDDSNSEIVASDPIPIKNIVKVYECRALSIMPGYLELASITLEPTKFRARHNYHNSSLPRATHGIKELPLSILGSVLQHSK